MLTDEMSSRAPAKRDCEEPARAERWHALVEFVPRRLDRVSERPEQRADEHFAAAAGHGRQTRLQRQIGRREFGFRSHRPPRAELNQREKTTESSDEATYGRSLTYWSSPAKFGKNGDQIQRLTRCPAEAFFIQYWSEVDDASFEQLEKLVQLKSYLEGRKLWYGMIDGDDSARVIQAYPAAFSRRRSGASPKKRR
jgi:hypothetical protein